MIRTSPIVDAAAGRAGTWTVVSVLGVAALIWLAAVACSGEAPSEQVQLRFQYEEGDTLRYVRHVTGTATMPDSTGEGTRTHEYERSMRMEEVASEITPRNHYVLTLTYHVQPKEEPGDGPEEGGEEEPETKAVSLSVEITPRGKIVRVMGVENAKQLFGDLDFQSMFEQTQPVFPERPLRPGDSWTQTVKVLSPTREPVETSSTYVLDDLVEIDGESIALIDFDGDIYLPVTYDPETSEGGLRSMEQQIRLRGTIHFAHQKGLVRKVEHTAEGTVSRVSLREGKPVRKSVEIDQEMTIELVESSR